MTHDQAARRSQTRARSFRQKHHQVFANFSNPMAYSPAPQRISLPVPRSSLWHTGHVRRVCFGRPLSSRSEACVVNHRLRHGAQTRCLLSARPTAHPASFSPLHMSSCAVHPKMQQRSRSASSSLLAPCATAFAAAARFASAIASAASRCDTHPVAADPSQVGWASAHCKRSQRSRHSRPLRPAT